MTMTISPLRTQKELHWKTFLIALITAAAFFIPFIIMDNGYFIFFGDFNVQQIPFYQMCHDKVRAGDFFWNWNTDLGVNFVGSYSFYLLGSPFFWLTIPFPSWMVPHLMGPLLILKFGCAAFTSYFYIRRFTKTPNSAMLGALLYAFSGFAVYNVFFNHFHEAIIFFPVLLLAVEKYIAENKRGILIFATFICALSNYFFFFGMAVFCIIYWFVRMLSGRWHMSLGRLGVFVFEIVLGVALAAFMLMPSYYSVMQNSRVNSILYGWDALLYGKNQIYLNVIEVFFFPPDLPARPVFFTGADVKWSSLGGWLPVFGMTGVFAFMHSRKGTWLKRILIILFVMSMVPILNSAFYAFNSAYYARWFYMPILMMCIATAVTTEDRSIDWKYGFKWTAIITMLFTVLVGLYPTGVNDDGSIKAWGLFTDSNKVGGNYFIKFWTSCAIAIVSLIIVFVLMRMRKKSFRKMMNAAVACVCIVSVTYAAIYIGTGKTQSYDAKSVVIDQLIEGEVDLPDKENYSYRTDVYDGVDNTGMYLGYPCIQAFHSIVPASIMNFYEYCGVERGVGSRPGTDNAALRPLLSVRFLFDRSEGKDFMDNSGNTEMDGWSFVKRESGYAVYENTNFIPYGFTYDYYMSWDQCDSYSEDHRSNMMLKAILLSDEQIERNKDILTDIGSVYDVQGDDSNGNTLGYKSTLKRITFSDSSIAEDSARRAKTAATDFVASSSGFTCDIDLDRENLVFFSVPYEENGWTAYVDGVQTDIENVNIGFMAVRAAAGNHTIEFRYMTPGLITGIKISVVAVAVIAVYLLVVFFRRRQDPESFAVDYPEGDEFDAALEADRELAAEFAPPEPPDSQPEPDPELPDPVDIAFRDDAEPPDETETEPPVNSAEKDKILDEMFSDFDEPEQEKPHRHFSLRSKKKRAESENHLLDKLSDSEPENEAAENDNPIAGGFSVHIDDDDSEDKE